MIYKGNLKSLFIKDLQITDNGINAVFDSVVIKKDSLFYKNFVGKLISFEYDTHLPSYSEAETFVRDSIRDDGSSLSCMYADYNNMQVVPDETRSVKELKKEFREQRKRRTNR